VADKERKFVIKKDPNFFQYFSDAYRVLATPSKIKAVYLVPRNSAL
jgi:hypothetical protein